MLKALSIRHKVYKNNALLLPQPRRKFSKRFFCKKNTTYTYCACSSTSDNLKSWLYVSNPGNELNQDRVSNKEPIEQPNKRTRAYAEHSNLVLVFNFLDENFERNALLDKYGFLQYSLGYSASSETVTKAEMPVSGATATHFPTIPV